MFRNKRNGAELTVNTMILMALGVLILIMAAFMIIRAYTNANDSQSCAAHNGDCRAECLDDKPVPGPYRCPDEKAKCCISIAGLGSGNKQP